MKISLESICHNLQSLFDAILDLDWFKLGLDIAWEILKGLAKALWEGIQTIFGKGWLWGTDDGVELNNTSTENTLSSITTTNVGERTTKVDETLEITLNVESDGTVASSQNLDVISDMLTDKIDKLLGDKING